MTLHLVSNLQYETWYLTSLRSPQDMMMQLQKEGTGKSCNPFATTVIEGVVFQNHAPVSLPRLNPGAQCGLRGR